MSSSPRNDTVCVCTKEQNFIKSERLPGKIFQMPFDGGTDVFISFVGAAFIKSLMPGRRRSGSGSGFFFGKSLAVVRPPAQR